MNAASERVEASRARLLAAMVPPVRAAEPRASASGGWQQRLLALPLVGEVLASVRAWWSHHPLRPVGHLAAEASGAAVAPIAQRHPMALVLGAAAIGASLAWARPWRWLFRSALFAGLLPQLASRVISSLPIESWMNLMGSGMDAARRAAPAQAGPQAPRQP